MTVKLKLLFLIVLFGFLLSQTIPPSIIITLQAKRNGIHEHSGVADIIIKEGSIITVAATKQSRYASLLKKNFSPAISCMGINTAQNAAGNYFQKTIYKPDFNKAKS